jgi:2-methylcitrate dehydratase PrpD
MAEALEDRVVAHLSETRFDDLPAEAVDAGRKCILDVLGVIVAGSRAAGIEALIRFLEPSSVPQATVLVYGTRLSAYHAAWVNGAMARAHELDDSHDATGHHISVPLMGTALAVAELAGPISGRDLLTAYVLAADLSARMRLAAAHRSGESGFAANTYAPFQAAALAAKLLGLQGQAMYDALAWAYTQCAGGLQLQQSGESALHVHHGLAGAEGLQAALMARHGLPGPDECLTGRFGFYCAYDGGLPNVEKFVDGLGERYEVTQVSMKQYPSGRVTHPPVEAALALHHEHALDPAQIAEVVVHYGPRGFKMTCEPEAERRLPTNPQHAKFSLYYNVACALVRGHVGIADFTPEALADETVRAVAAKIRVPIDPAPRSNRPARVIVRLRDGRELERDFPHLRGTPENPVSFDDCADKLRAALPFAARPLDPARIETAIGLVRELESVDDVRELVALFRPAGGA